MTEGPIAPSTSRPVLLGKVGEPRTIKRPSGGGKKRVDFKNPEDKATWLDGRFDEAMGAYDLDLEFAASVNAADPQLVLVFEALDEVINLEKVAKLVGFEVLGESEGSMEPNADYGLSKKARDPEIKTCLHAICLNSKSRDELLSIWKTWKKTRRVKWGYSNLRDLFVHLHDIRIWGPQDRLKTIDWEEYFGQLIPGQPRILELELWFKQSASDREQSEHEVRAVVESQGGSVLSSVIMPEIGYHGVKCHVPDSLLRSLAAGDYDRIQIVKSANVMYLRITGQLISPAGDESITDVQIVHPLPTGLPTVCVLDGVPVANHPLLAGRVEVYDPDDLASETMTTVEKRLHGTRISSAIVWGDLNAGNMPLKRPVLVRPIMAPSKESSNGDEEISNLELIPDLMRRVFLELFEGGDSTSENIVAVNLSIGDPSTKFDSTLSSWARTLDWLSYKYGVLVIVSAGNCPSLPIDSNTSNILSLAGPERRDSILRTELAHQNARRMISPAEAVNALTVGSTHDDASSALPVGYAFDPSDGEPMVSYFSPFGGGYGRSLKPELAAPGGRALLGTPLAGDKDFRIARRSSLGPGIRVASSTPGRDVHGAGTSYSAALVTRRAAELNDVLDDITAGQTLTRRQRAVAIKALLAHGARHPSELLNEVMPLEKKIGFGVVNRNYADGCESNEAAVLYFGSLGDAEAQELLLPLPDGLNIREAKRITATLAWLSPTNWRHRQYRRASLTFAAPSGVIPSLGAGADLSDSIAGRGSNTIKHLVWETNKAFAAGRDSEMSLRVKCFEQAGGLGGERIDYAVVLSLWVAPTIGVDVYSQVRDQIGTRVPITPGM